VFLFGHGLKIFYRLVLRITYAFKNLFDGRKMSKSYKSTIEIFAGEKQLRKAIAGIATDSTPGAAPKNPDKCHLLGTISFFPDEGENAFLR
jgi:tryptophanyl-tRNA synthetase